MSFSPPQSACTADELLHSSVGEIHLSSTLTETLSSLVPGGELYDTSSVGPHLASAYGAAVQADILSVRSCLGEPIVGNFDVTSLSLGRVSLLLILHAQLTLSDRRYRDLKQPSSPNRSAKLDPSVEPHRQLHHGRGWP